MVVIMRPYALDYRGWRITTLPHDKKDVHMRMQRYPIHRFSGVDSKLSVKLVTVFLLSLVGSRTASWKQPPPSPVSRSSTVKMADKRGTCPQTTSSSATVTPSSCEQGEIVTCCHKGCIMTIKKCFASEYLCSCMRRCWKMDITIRKVIFLRWMWILNKHHFTVVTVLTFIHFRSSMSLVTSVLMDTPSSRLFIV